MSKHETLTINRLRSIADIDAGDWDRLAENEVYARHGWLRVVEKTVVEAGDPVYFLLCEDDDLVGAAVCYRLTAVGSSLDEICFGRPYRFLSRIGFTLSPALYCGPMLGQGRHILWRRDAARPARVLARLLDALSAFAAENRLTLAFAKLPVDEDLLLDALAGRGFARTMNWPVSYVDIRWKTFDAYLSALGPGMATKARREVAGPGRTGIAVGAVAGFRDLAQDMLELLDANQRAHSAMPLGLQPEFFEALADHHAASCIVTVARLDGMLAGAALLLTTGDCAGGPLIGLSDDPRNRKGFTHFNLALYEPIRICIERGVERLYLGAGLYDMKRRRGCRELELAMLIRPRSLLGRAASKLWCAVHRRWAARKLERQGVRLPPSPVSR